MTNQALPINRSFASLDAYLDHLELTQAPIDKPWYKQVAPGMYRLQTGNLRLLEPSKEKTTFTRKELELKFGFSS